VTAPAPAPNDPTPDRDTPQQDGDTSPDATSPGATSQSGATRYLRVTRSLAIPLEELRWRFAPSGGPGGQHANRSSTRAEVIFDVAASRSLGPRQRARLLERLGKTVRVAADDERSQARNRALALERLGRRLEEALRTPRMRIPTAVPPGVAARRVADKRRRGARKRERVRPPDEET
jgi:ribosome-associated protein